MIRAAPVFLAALLLGGLLLRAGIDSYAAIAAYTALTAYVVMTAGRLLLVATGERRFDPPIWFALGLIATCLAVYVLTAAFSVIAAHAFVGVAAGVILLRVVLRRRFDADIDWRRLAGFALCIALTYAWCRPFAAAYDSVRSLGVLPVWSDYFFHGGMISQFGDPRALGHQSIHFAGMPATFYHFGSYTVAAALAGMLDQPGLALALTVWLPLGFLAMTSGAYALGERLAGAAGGVAALAAIAIIPDASNYGLRNGYFSFDWTLTGHAGATYALGAAFVSLVFLDRWATDRSRPALIASALLAPSTLLLRFHIFVLFFPAWIGTAGVASAPRPELRRYVAWGMLGVLAAGAIAAFVTVAHLYATDPGFWRFRGPALWKFLEVVHTGQEPTAYPGLYDYIASAGAPVVTLIAGIVLVFIAAFGAFVALLPAAFLLARDKGLVRPIDAACGYLVYTWLLLIVFAPVAWDGDPTELNHRPFVLLYSAVAIWSLCLLLRVLATKISLTRKVWPVALSAAVLVLPAVIATAPEMIQPKFRWGQRDASTRIPPGLVEAAAYLREHAVAGDFFAAAGLSAEYAPFDLSMQLCSLSGMPAYLSRPFQEMAKGPNRRQVAAARLAAMQTVDGAADYGSAMRQLQRLGVRWYVDAEAHGPRWDPARKRAAFKSGTVALYAVAQNLPSGAALHDDMPVLWSYSSSR